MYITIRHKTPLESPAFPQPAKVSDRFRRSDKRSQQISRSGNKDSASRLRGIVPSSCGAGYMAVGPGMSSAFKHFFSNKCFFFHKSRKCLSLSRICTHFGTDRSVQGIYINVYNRSNFKSAETIIWLLWFSKRKKFRGDRGNFFRLREQQVSLKALN